MQAETADPAACLNQVDGGRQHHEVLSIYKASSSEHSSIEHLARNLSLSREWGELLLGMMTACFDASGHESHQPFVVVAGFVSSAKHWADFDKAWRERLSEDGLTYFHMVEFAHSVKQFSEGWKDNKPRRDALLSDLMGIIRGFAYRKFVCMVENKVLMASLKKEIRDSYNLKSYVLGARDCAARVREWTNEFKGREVPELVFEYGDLWLLIPMKVVSDSDLIPVTGSDAVAVTIGAKRRWRSYRA